MNPSSQPSPSDRRVTGRIADTTLQAAASVKEVPALQPEQMAKAQELALRIAPSNHQIVLSFGDQIQRGVADFSTKVLDSVSLAETGRVGELLTGLQTTVRGMDPEVLKGPTTLVSKLFSLLPWAQKVQDRIDGFVTRHQTLRPTLEKFEHTLGLEQGKATIAIEQVQELAVQNREYLQALQIAKVAMIIASNSAAVAYEHRRTSLGQSAEMSELQDLKRNWDDLQRLDRRLFAIEASIALANTNDIQMGRVQEMLLLNAEALGEARDVMIPAWRTNIALAITLLNARSQLELVNAFRKMTDDLLGGTADLVAEIESNQADMQKRTFVAAEVIARVNSTMAQGIEAALTKQMDAKQARDEGLKTIAASQERLAQAMRQAGTALVATSATTASPAPALPVDLAASLLDRARSDIRH